MGVEWIVGITLDNYLEKFKISAAFFLFSIISI